jgi:putative hydrolase
MTYKIDLHTHTTASGHAYSSVMEMIAWAKKNNIAYLGLSDHSPGMPGSAYIYHFQNLRVIPREVDGVKVLRGVEANIIDVHGHIDMNEDNMKKLDYVIASMHPPCIAFGSKIDNTKAMIGAIKNPYVNIVGHPDDARYPIDYEEVMKAAKDYNVLLEVNNGSLDPRGYRPNAKNNVLTYLSLAEKHKHPVILGSDAHIGYSVGDFQYILPVLEEGKFDQGLIINDNYEKLSRFLNNSPF